MALLPKHYEVRLSAMLLATATSNLTGQALFILIGVFVSAMLLATATSNLTGEALGVHVSVCECVSVCAAAQA